ncbi:hypothetical protein E4T56_gene6274 [Termitomyces sp. T112]|nr:hypothetical protein E4T56_gene6274 [Termitomyces sp. T112]
MPTLDNSDASSAKPDSPLANSNTFPAAFNASSASSEPLEPSLAVPDANVHYQFNTLVYPTNSRASQLLWDSLHSQLIPSFFWDEINTANQAYSKHADTQHDPTPD